MSNFKKCVFLDAERSKAILKWAVTKMKEGVSSPAEMYTEFYAFISKGGLS